MTRGSRWTEYEAAIEGGRFRRAIEVLVDAYTACPDDAPDLITFLRTVARSAPRGVIWEQGPIIAALREIEVCAGYDPGTSPCWSGVESLWAAREPRLGVATFPVAFSLADELLAGSGTLRELRVVHQGDPQEGDPIPEDDEGFQEAVKAARSWVVRKLGPFEVPPESSYRWEVLPRTPSNAQLTDRSAGMAALVALVSYIRRMVVPPDCAFTGELRGDQFEPVDGLRAKVEALDERPQVRRFFSPGDLPSSVTKPPQLDVIDFTAPGSVLREVFGALWGLTTEPPHPAPEARRSPEALTQVKDEVKLRLQALVHAARPRALTIHTLEQALDGFRPRRDFMGARVADVLDEMIEAVCRDPSARGVVLAPEGRYTCREDETHPDDQRYREAHRRLAEVLHSREGERDGDWLSGAALHWHRAGEPDARDEALVRLAGTSSAAAFDSTLRVVEGLREDREGRMGLRSLTERLERESKPGPVLVRLALLVHQMPAPVAAMAHVLTIATSWGERVLALQAAFEAALQLLAWYVVAVMREDPDARAALCRGEHMGQLSRRPSLGDLAALVNEAKSSASSPQESALDWAGPVPAVTKRRDPLQSLVRRLNDAIHHLGAWEELLLDPEGRAARNAFDDLSHEMLPVMVSFAEVFAAHPLLFCPAGGSTPRELTGPGPHLASGEGRYAFSATPGAETGHRPVFLDGLLVPLGSRDDIGRAAFYRGELGGRVRYWSYTEYRDRWGELPSDGSSEPLLVSRDLKEVERTLGEPVDPSVKLEPWEAPLPRVGDLPWPLARAVRFLERADAPAEHLAAVDLAFHLLLRLNLFALYAVECPDPSDLPKYLRSYSATKKWLVRPTKRNLFEAIEQRASRLDPATPVGGFAGWLRDPESVSAVNALTDTLERIEHLPGPLSRYERALSRMTGTMGWLLQRCPWTASLEASPPGWHLVGRAPSGGLVSLQGPGAARALPDDHVFNLSPGEVAFVSQSSGDETPSVLHLSPFARVIDQARAGPEVWLVDQSEKKVKSFECFTLGFGGISRRRKGQPEQVPGCVRGVTLHLTD